MIALSLPSFCCFSNWTSDHATVSLQLRGCCFYLNSHMAPQKSMFFTSNASILPLILVSFVILFHYLTRWSWADLHPGWNRLTLPPSGNLRRHRLRFAVAASLEICDHFQRGVHVLIGARWPQSYHLGDFMGNSVTTPQLKSCHVWYMFFHLSPKVPKRSQK